MTDWFTKMRPDYSAHPMAKYIIMIKGPDDPARRPRPVGGQEDRFPHHTLNKMTESQIAKALIDLLSDGVARTLNRMGVELWDKEGSIVGGTKVEEVLWTLVESGTLAFTKKTPILFRAMFDSPPPTPPSRSSRVDLRRAVTRRHSR